MKTLIRKYTGISLIARIVAGLLAGTLLGVLVPGAEFVAIFGWLFVGALKGIAPVLVFFLIVSAIVNANGQSISRRFTTVIVLYAVSTLLAAASAVLFSFVFPTSLPIEKVVDNVAVEMTPPSGIIEVLNSLLTNMVVNPLACIANANYLGILFWSIILGVALKTVSHNRMGEGFRILSNAVTTTVKWIIECAPFGIMGIVFHTISTNGLNIFVTYGKLIAVLVGCMLFVALVLTPLMVGVTLRTNPYPLVFRCYRESGVTAFFTRSSAANLPVNMALCERMGLNSQFYSVSLPLGATINMNGAAITITIMTLATVYTMGLSVDVPTAILLSLLATIGACGASGVAGGSLLLIPMACSLFGIPDDISMQVVAMGFVIGVIQDSMETALNSSSDVIFTATAELYERRK